MLYLAAPDSASTSKFQTDESLVAKVALKDGRVLDMQTKVRPPRPRVTLVSKSIQAGPNPSAIRLGAQDLLPQDGKISFFMKSDLPERFSRDERVEVATEDESFHATLGVGDGSLVMQDAETVMAIFEPLKSFGSSAFGQLRFRAISEEGRRGGLDSAGDAGALAFPERGTVSRQPGQAVPAEWVESVLDGVGGLRPAVYPLRAGPRGICRLVAKRAAA